MRGPEPLLKHGGCRGLVTPVPTYATTGAGWRAQRSRGLAGAGSCTGGHAHAFLPSAASELATRPWQRAATAPGRLFLGRQSGFGGHKDQPQTHLTCHSGTLRCSGRAQGAACERRGELGQRALIHRGTENSCSHHYQAHGVSIYASSWGTRAGLLLPRARQPGGARVTDAEALTCWASVCWA